MAQFFEMPQASPTMETGTLLSWKKKEGDTLAPQDVLAEVETDKAAMDIEVFEKTVLLKVLAQEGDEIPAGQPIAIIGQAGDDISALLADFEARKGAAPKAAPAKPSPTPPAAAAPAPTPAPTPAPKPAVPTAVGFVAGRYQGKPLPAGIMELPEHFSVEAQVRASPLARKIAAQKGVDLGSVAGSGPHGRIVRQDVEAQGSGGARQLVARPDQAVPHSKMRKTIAKRLGQVWQEAPVFYLNAVFKGDRLVDLRQQWKEQEIAVSFNDLVLRAVALALRDVPEVNASWGDDAITRHGSVHLGMAVAVDDGLITTVIRHADQKSVQQISAEARALAAKARDRKLQPEEYAGSTFSVSNLGMMGIEHFTAILNPPEAGILAVGSLKQEAVLENGTLSTGYRMRVTMTCDHRVIDGALGARFLQALRGYIEIPIRLV